MSTNQITANDNAPAHQSQNWADENLARGANTGAPRQSNLLPSSPGGLIYTSAYSPVKSGVKIERPYLLRQSQMHTGAKIQQQSKIKRKPPNGFTLMSLLLIWLIGAVLIARFSGGTSNRPLVGENLALASGAFGFLSLYLSRIARLRDAKIIHSLSISSACLGLGWCVWHYAGAYLSTLSVEYLCVGIATGTLLLAAFFTLRFFPQPFASYGFGVGCFLVHHSRNLTSGVDISCAMVPTNV